MLDRLENLTPLDRPADWLRRGAATVLRGRVRDALHGVWLGHPLHPMMVQLPIGAWISAAALDALRLDRRAAATLVAVGAAAVPPAAVAGLNDWASLSREQRRVGLVHAAANTVALGLYVGSLVARARGDQRLGRRLGYAGLTAMGAGGYLGGHLSYRQAAGVNQAEPLLRRMPDGWHDLCAYESLTVGRPAVAWMGEVPVLVIRTGGDVTVMLERCGHQTGPLGEGELTRVAGEDCVVCPWHGSTFRLADGAPVTGPAATAQPLLRSRVTDGRVQAALP